MGRRIMYYWSLLNKSDDELAKKVLDIQKKFPVSDDWILDVKENLKFYEINLSENQIKNIKNNTFKNIVKKQMKSKAEDFLFTLKEKHSKTENLQSFKFQDYLKSNKISTEEKKLLFQLRTRSTHTKANYKNKYKFDISCSMCNDKVSIQTDAHLLTCSTIVDALATKTELLNVNHKDIFGNVIQQIKIIQVYKEIFKILI